MKSRPPIVSAFMVLGKTFAWIIAVFVFGSGITHLLSGKHPQEAMWGFALIFTFLAPIALLAGIVLAVKKFVKERHKQKTGLADSN